MCPVTCFITVIPGSFELKNHGWIRPFRCFFPCRNHKGHAPVPLVRPGPYYGYQVSFSLRSGPETGFVAICIVFQTKNCDVLPHIMHKVTFTSPHRIHIFVEMCVCMSTARLGILIYDRDQTCSTKFWGVIPKGWYKKGFFYINPWSYRFSDAENHR